MLKFAITFFLFFVSTTSICQPLYDIKQWDLLSIQVNIVGGTPSVSSVNPNRFFDKAKMSQVYSLTDEELVTSEFPEFDSFSTIFGVENRFRFRHKTKPNHQIQFYYSYNRNQLDTFSFEIAARPDSGVYGGKLSHTIDYFGTGAAYQYVFNPKGRFQFIVGLDNLFMIGLSGQARETLYEEEVFDTFFFTNEQNNDYVIDYGFLYQFGYSLALKVKLTKHMFIGFGINNASQLRVLDHNYIQNSLNSSMFTLEYHLQK